MKFVRYEWLESPLGTGLESDENSAWVEDDNLLVDIASAYEWHCHVKGLEPDVLRKYTWSRLNELVRDWKNEDRWKQVDELRSAWREAYQQGDDAARDCVLRSSEVRLRPPIRPHSFRDFYAFEQHVKTCRAKRGLDMVPEWYEFPVFYFSNPNSFRGSDEPVWAPRGCRELDFELEVACVLGKPGLSIPAETADAHIAGYTVLNDWSARDLQREEVKVGLGPAKAKDFATSFGPYFVTPDELCNVAHLTERGVRHDLAMRADVNGKVISAGNLFDLHYTFAEMIERASADAHVFAGDVIGSGTVGTGCILEMGTDVQPWLVPGDVVTLSVQRLGSLRTPIAARSESAFEWR